MKWKKKKTNLKFTKKINSGTQNAMPKWEKFETQPEKNRIPKCLRFEIIQNSIHNFSARQKQKGIISKSIWNFAKI